MKTFLTAAVALSVLASAGVASAQPYRGDDRRDHAERHYDRDIRKVSVVRTFGADGGVI